MGVRVALNFNVKTFIAILLFICDRTNGFEKVMYDPKWDSLDKRPLPQWYDEAKFGIFLHWGVYSVPGFGSEWFWMNWQTKSEQYVSYMKENYSPHFTYQDFARDFTAEFFNPEHWADLFKKSGAKYVVLTSKHHEGFTLWPSRYSFSWNAKDVGPKRDLIGELSKAIRNRTDLKFGVYHSLYEWFNPMYVSDKKSNFSEDNFVKKKILPEMMELVDQYHPEVIWSDGDWEASDDYWQSKEFLSWLYNESPVKNTVVVNDRWGRGIPCHHGDFFTCKDRYNPGVLQKHKYENAMTVDKKSWGYRRNSNCGDIFTVEELISTLAETVSTGGNLLMNVGPTKEGTIDNIFQERLLQMGEWLAVNGEAIYGTKPWTYQNDSLSGRTWYTSKGNVVYATTLRWPESGMLKLADVVKLFRYDKSIKVSVLGTQQELKWTIGDKYVTIKFPDKADVINDWAWAVKMTSSKNNSTETNEIPKNID